MKYKAATKCDKSIGVRKHGALSGQNAKKALKREKQ